MTVRHVKKDSELFIDADAQRVEAVVRAYMQPDLMLSDIVVLIQTDGEFLPVLWRTKWRCLCVRRENGRLMQSRC